MLNTWCPQCGPDADVDEDGCCLACGATSIGFGAELACELMAERDNLRRALEWISSEFNSGTGPTDLDYFDTMVNLGLLVPVPATEEFKDDWGEDTMYVLSWKALT